MDGQKNVYLIGPMGAGKSAVGLKLAQMTGRQFADTDAIVEERCGVDIAFIFDKEGEQGFRGREFQILTELALQSGLVVATGGGIVTQEKNRKALSRNGIVVYLKTSVEQQFERTRYGNTRPLLDNDDPLQKLTSLSAERGPLYEKLADITVVTDGQHVKKVAGTIADMLEKYDGKKKDPRMQTITVELGSRSYPIYIGEGLLSSSEFWAHFRATINIPPKLLIVSDQNVAPHYYKPVQQQLKPVISSSCVLTAGEEHKNIDSYQQILNALIEGGFQRDTAVVALGGGVVGDMAGFASASFMRGIDFIQIPTTLLAQVDSSVGGKTGINHALGKNLIGAFHQPLAVIIDTDTLSTLAPREVRAGLAEVIKYGCIYDTAFFSWLEEHIAELLDLDAAALAYAIKRSVEIKAAIVARDEKEKGERALLNFGHSFGHAIEQATGYSVWLHGEAVAIGMLMAAELSARMGCLDDTEVRRLESLIANAGLAINAGGIDHKALVKAMQKDKKNTATEQRLILLNGLGRSQVRTDCSQSDIDASLTRFNSVSQ